MEKLNKIYITYFRDNSFHYYSLEESLKAGINQFHEMFHNKYNRFPDGKEELDEFIMKEIDDPTFMISIISGNRLRFKTSKELIDFFMNNIRKIKNEDLYDFLLSMVQSHDMFYNYKGECIGSEITSQCPYEEYVWDAHIEFTEESCKDGKFRFSYDDIGIDTLYHARWIKEK